MRVYEMTAHLQKISRSKGRTATAAAAYRSCSLINCTREGQVHDFRRKQGLEASAIVLPTGAPSWAANRADLWNAAELRERNGARGPNAGTFKARAVTAREVVFGFPAELSAVGRIDVAQAVARHLAQAHELAADYAIHKPGKDGDQRNHHCHMMMTTRRLTANGLEKKAREWDDVRAGRETVAALRAFLAQTMNAALAREGKAGEVHVEHRSLSARGGSRVATKHQGPGKTTAQRNRARQDRTLWTRETRERQVDRHARERAKVTPGSPAAHALAEKHQREDRQLDRAVESRQERDRIAESVHRRAQAERGIDREHDRARDHERPR